MPPEIVARTHKPTPSVPGDLHREVPEAMVHEAHGLADVAEHVRAVVEAARVVDAAVSEIQRDPLRRRARGLVPELSRLLPCVDEVVAYRPVAGPRELRPGQVRPDDLREARVQPPSPHLAEDVARMAE